MTLPSGIATTETSETRGPQASAGPTSAPEREAKGTLLIVLCGVPGSGKSTIATELIRHLGDVEVIATDAIGGRYGRYTKLRRRLDELAGRRRYVVLDGTFYARRHRDAVREIGYPVLLVYLKCPIEVCLMRNRARRKPIPVAGVLGIHRRFEPPTPEEWPLVIPTDRTEPGAAVRRIYRAIVRRALGRRVQGAR